jgi:diguanylate cyclase (GGDEF)-like protein
MIDRTERERLAVLDQLGLLDTPPEKEFDTVVGLARRLLGCAIALVTLVDQDRQWFKAKSGLAIDQTPRGIAFCAHAVAAGQVLVVPDAQADARFAANPLVTGAPGIRAYAGVPIRAAADARSPALPVGTLCVIDDRPRDFSAEDLAMLADLAGLVEGLIAARSWAVGALRLAEERGTALHRLDQTNRKLRQAERMANMGSWRLSLADNRTEWSAQTYAIHGLAPGEDPQLETALDFYPLPARTVIEAALQHTIRSGEPFDIETDFVTAQGALRRVRSMGELELHEGTPVALVGVFQDISERYQMEQALRGAAETDALTGLASRGHFNACLEARVASGEPLALLLIDLDHFKAVNDRCGHLAGDDLLCAMATRLRAPWLAGSFAARLGGDEFVLIVTDRHLLADLPGVIRRLLTDLRDRVDRAPELVQVSATIGGCWRNRAAATAHDLLQHADAALYEAKRFRRGTAKIFGQHDLILADGTRFPPSAISAIG